MSNFYSLLKKALLLSSLLLFFVPPQHTRVIAFQVVAGRSTAIARKSAVLWANAASSGANNNVDKAEECIVTDLERARDCANNVGECDVEELEDLTNGSLI